MNVSDANLKEAGRIGRAAIHRIVGTQIPDTITQAVVTVDVHGLPVIALTFYLTEAQAALIFQRSRP